MKKGRKTKKKKSERKQNAEIDSLRPFWDQGRLETLTSKEEERKKRRRNWPTFKIS